MGLLLLLWELRKIRSWKLTTARTERKIGIVTWIGKWVVWVYLLKRKSPIFAIFFEAKLKTWNKGLKVLMWMGNSSAFTAQTSIWASFFSDLISRRKGFYSYNGALSKACKSNSFIVIKHSALAFIFVAKYPSIFFYRTLPFQSNYSSSLKLRGS